MAKKLDKKQASAKSLAGVAIPSVGTTPAVLDRLWQVVLDRRNADPAVSHSARLLSRGVPKIVAGNREALIAESADVLYHLLVLWVGSGVHPSEVWAELERREGVSGIAEKAARKVLAPGGTTRKIP